MGVLNMVFMTAINYDIADVEDNVISCSCVTVCRCVAVWQTMETRQAWLRTVASRGAGLRRRAAPRARETSVTVVHSGGAPEFPPDTTYECQPAPASPAAACAAA